MEVKSIKQVVLEAEREGLLNSKGKTINGNLIKSDNVLPLLISGYNFHNLTEDEKLVPPLGFDKILDAPVATVANLNTQPGDDFFLFWFTVSTTFPLISSCIAPLANMMSIIGLAQHWRAWKLTGELANDPVEVRVLNSLSLFFGLIGNTSLLLNFSNTKVYILAQLISLFCWSIAWITLMIGVLLLNYYHMSSEFIRTEGQWLSVFTIAMYGVCTLTMSVNCLGFILNKYPPLLNLNQKERNLMKYTVTLAVWLVIGACVCKKIMLNLEYGPSLYFCVVSVLTIGFGDIVPHDSSTQAFILVFSLVGVILMGLVVAMIRQVLHNTNKPIVLWHRMEVERKLCLKLIKEGNIKINPKDSFNIMRRIEHKSRLEQESLSLVSTMFVFFIFWFIGAVVFKYSESWLYLDSIYFCLLCLITIGYGDFTPKSPFGRVFFIAWAIAAVPLMTILISNIGDTLFGSSLLEGIWTLLKSVKNVMFVTTKRIISLHTGNDLLSYNSVNQELGEDVLQRSEHYDTNIESRIETKEPHENPFRLNTNTLESKIKTRKEDLLGILDFLNDMKPILEDALESPSIEYDHDAWTALIEKLRGPEHYKHYIDNEYWLSEESPMRLPLQEPNYFISRFFYKIETDLMKLLSQLDNDISYLEREKYVINND